MAVVRNLSWQLSFNAPTGAITRTNQATNALSTRVSNLGTQLTRTASNFGNAMGSIGSVALKAGAAIAKIGAISGAAAIAIGAYSLNLAGEMEQTNIAFETMLKSSDKAKEFISQLKDFAIATPFEFKDLTDSTKKMLAFGFTAQEVIPMLTAVGDAASGLGLGADGVNRITLALGQMKAKSKVSADEMLQLTEAGIPAWQILADKIGVSTAEVMKLSEKGLIPANSAIKMLQEGMEDKFGNMMAKQSKTLLGLFSSLKDFVNLNLFGALGEGLRQGLLPYLDKLVNYLTNNKQGMKAFADQLTEVGKSIGDFIGRTGEKLANWFKTLAERDDFKKADFGGKFMIAMNSAFDGLRKWLDGEGGTKLKNIFSKISEFLVEVLTLAIPQLTEFALKLGASIATGVAEGTANGLSKSLYGDNYFDISKVKSADDYNKLTPQKKHDAWETNNKMPFWDGSRNELIPSEEPIEKIDFNRISSKINMASTATKGFLNKLNLPKGIIPGFATGINNFDGGMALVGEEGPEIVNLPSGSDVIPNRQSRQMLGGGTTNHNNFTFQISDSNAGDIAQKVRDVVEDIFYQQSVRTPAIVER